MNRPKIKDFFAEKANLSTVHNEYKNSPHLYSYSSELDRYVDFLEEELSQEQQTESEGESSADVKELNVIRNEIAECFKEQEFTNFTSIMNRFDNFIYTKLKSLAKQETKASQAATEEEEFKHIEKVFKEHGHDIKITGKISKEEQQTVSVDTDKIRTVLFSHIENNLTPLGAMDWDNLKKQFQSTIEQSQKSVTTITDKEIEEMYPLENEHKASDYRPLTRIQAYNSRQMDRREGAKRLLQRIKA